MDRQEMRGRDAVEVGWVTHKMGSASETETTISWITGDPVEEDSHPYPCRFCRSNPVAPGWSFICTQCIEDLNTPAVPADEVQSCPQGATTEADCRKCFEDSEVRRLSRTGGWKGHCGYWQRNRRLDGTEDPRGIFEDSIRYESAEWKETIRYLRRCADRLGIDGRRINDDVHDLLITPGGIPRSLRQEQREAMRRLGKTRERLTRDDVLQALATPKSKSKK